MRRDERPKGPEQVEQRERLHEPFQSLFSQNIDLSNGESEAAGPSTSVPPSVKPIESVIHLEPTQYFTRHTASSDSKV